MLLSVGLLRSLPPELVRSVLEELKKEDLLNLRITCKAMNCYASPLAFEELHVWLEEQSLQNLCNIASDPILCKNVRKIVLGMDYFYNLNYGEFKKYVFLEETHRPTPSLNRSERDQRRKAWCVYRRYYLKQLALEESGRDLAMMTQALKAFSSLISVKLMDYQPWVDGDKGPRLLKTEKSLRKDMLTVPNHQIRIPRGGQQIRVLLQALAVSGRKIEELFVYQQSANISPTGFHGPLPEAFQSIAAQALTGLKRLILILDPISSDFLAALKKQSQELSYTIILRAATGVERLWVHLPEYCEQPWREYIQLSRVGQLKELFLTDTVLHEADFVLFLRSSCQGLQKLTIGDAWVKEQSWDLIFETIRSLPNLKEIRLYSLWHDIRRGGTRFLEVIDPQPLYDYLLRRSNDNPWDSMCQAEWFQLFSSESETDSEDSDQESN